MCWSRFCTQQIVMWSHAWYCHGVTVTLRHSVCSCPCITTYFVVTLQRSNLSSVTWQLKYLLLLDRACPSSCPFVLHRILVLATCSLPALPPAYSPLPIPSLFLPIHLCTHVLCPSSERKCYIYGLCKHHDNLQKCRKQGHVCFDIEEGYSCKD